MNPSEFISLAGHLVANPAFRNEEARYRSAISRAYYGALHLASAFLEECGKRLPKNHTAHEEAYRLLYSTNVETAKLAAHNLNDLRGERNKADYRMDGGAGMDSRSNAQEKIENGSRG
jgi:uncharacterized protein (UPF0332 family)